MKKIAKTILKILSVLVILIVIVAFLLTFHKVQAGVAHEFAKWFSNKTDTKLTVGGLKIDFFHDLHLTDVVLTENNGDTIAVVSDLMVNGKNMLKPERVIQKVILDGVDVRIIRRAEDGSYNIDNILNAFPKKEEKKKKDSLALRLNKIKLKDINALYKDEWNGQLDRASIDELLLDASNLDINSSQLIVDAIQITNPSFEMVYTDRSIYNQLEEAAKKDKIKDTTEKEPISALVKAIKIDGGHFHYFKPLEKAPSDRDFNQNNIDLTGIALDANDLTLDTTGINYILNNLAATDRSGLKLRNFKSKVHMSNSRTDFMSSTLNLNRSSLKGDLSFDYGNIGLLSFFIDTVVMDIKLRNSTLVSDDIAYFSNALSLWKLNANLDIDFLGTVNNFKSKIYKLNTKKGTSIKGQLAMQGLPNIEKTKIMLHNADISTNMQTLAPIVPALTQIDALDFYKLGQMYFKGNFDGTYQRFDIAGSAGSPRGHLDLHPFHLDMSNPDAPFYKGSVDFYNLNLSEFLVDMPVLKGHGAVTFDAHGFDIDKMYIDANSDFDYVQVGDTRYDNINFNGRIKGNGVEAKLASASELLDGVFDFSLDLNKDNETQLVGQFDRIDLQKMGIVDVPCLIRGAINADLHGDFNKNLLGFVNLQNAYVRYDDKELSDQYLNIKADTRNSISNYTLETPGMMAQMDGRFSIDQLQPMVQNLINYYLPAYAQKSTVPIGKDASAHFYVKGDSLQKYIGLFLPDFWISDSVLIDARIQDQYVKMDGYIPSLKYQEMFLSTLRLNVLGDKEKLNNKIRVSEFKNGNESIFNTVDLTALMADDRIDFNIKTLDNDSNQNTLSSVLLADKDTFFFKIEPSSIFIDNNNWRIESEGYSFMYGSYLDVAKTVVKNEISEFQIKSINKLGEPYPVLNLELEEFDLKNITDFVEGDMPELSSLISGNIDVHDPLGDLLVNADIALKDFEIDENLLGNIELLADYSLNNQLLTIDPKSGILNNDTWIKLTGNVHTDTSGRLDLSLNASHFDISPFQPFVETFMSQLKGELNAQVDIKGKMDEVQLEGNMDLSQLSFFVKEMGNAYRIPKINLSIDQNLFQIDSTTLYDEDDNEAYLYGLLAHQNFSNVNFSLDFWSDKFRTLNTTSDDNSSFYGHATTSLKALIFGTLDNLVFGLDIEPVEECEVWAVNTEGVGDPSLEGIAFYGISDYLDTIAADVDSTRIELQVSAELSELFKAHYVINPADNSTITVTGSGDVTVNMPIGYGAEDEGMTVYGGYKVTEGNIVYFNSRNLELSQLAGRKNFIIDPGTSVLLNGDPLNAKITGGAYSLIKVSNLEGMFTAEQLDDIKIANPAALSTIYEAQNVKVGIELQAVSVDDLGNIGYQISLPEMLTNSTVIDNRLAQINSDPNESKKQVISLLVLNSFLSEDNISTRMVLNTALGNTANIFTSRIASSLNDALRNVTNINNLEIGLGLSFDDQTAQLDDQNSYLPVVNVNGKMRFLDDRLTLKVGYDFDVGANQTSNPENDVTGDYKLEYLLNPAQNLIAYVYRNSSYDPLLSSKGKVNRAGVGLSYSFSYDEFIEVYEARRSFREAKKDRKQQRKEKREEKKSANVDSTGTLQAIKEEE